MSKPYKFAIGVAALTVVAALGMWLWPPVQTNSEAQIDQGQSTPTDAAPKPSAQVWQERTALQVGRYALDYHMAMAGPQALGNVDVGLKAALELGAPKDHSGGVWQPARLQSAVLKLSPAARSVTDFAAAKPSARDSSVGGSSVGDSSAEDRTAELERPFMVRFAATGQIEEVRFAPGLSASARATLAAVVAGLQVVRPSGAGSTWQAQERDLNGTFVANYRLGPDGELTKTWRVATADGQPGGKRALGYKMDAKSVLRASRGRLLEVAVDQNGQIRTNGTAKGGISKFESTIRLRRIADANTAWTTSLDPAHMTVFTANSAARPMPRGKVVPILEMLALAVQVDTDTPLQDKARTRAELARTLRADPKGLAMIDAKLRRGQLSEPAERLLIEALVQTNTAASQRAVVSLLKDTLAPVALRERTLTAAAFVQTPTAEFVRAMQVLAYKGANRSYGARAAMVLGAAISQVALKDGDAASKAASRLIDEADARISKSGRWSTERLAESELCDWLAALGNTGASGALPAILKGLAHGSEQVRISAALALRFQDPAKAMPAMHKAMSLEASIHVRDGIVASARTMGPLYGKALVQKALFYDRSEYVRRGAAYTIAGWAKEAPGLRKLLVEALGRETEADLRESLRNYLNPGRVAAPFRQAAAAGGKP